MYGKANRLPKNLRYPPYYRLDINSYFWDDLENKTESILSRIREKGYLDTDISDKTLNINRDLRLEDVMIGVHMAKICQVTPFIVSDLNQELIPVITIRIVGFKNSVNWYKDIMEFAINHRFSARTQLKKELSYWKQKVKNRERWKRHKIKDIRTLASQLDKFEYRYFKKYLKSILELHKRSPVYARKKADKEFIANYLKENQIKYPTLNRKNYERIRSDIGAN